VKVLVTGREGQVARSLADCAAAYPDLNLEFAARPEFDLLKPDALRLAILASRPDVVISAAAYTAVDQAEDEPQAAFAINAAGAGAVAAAAREAGAAIIHLSTDYVFSGEGEGPRVETDAPAPANVYGHSKLEGEIRVAEANPRHVIVRTSWVYSAYGKNFVKTMLRLAAERDRVSVVADQWGNPTAAADVAEGILRIARQIGRAGAGSPRGVFHLAGEGSTTWAGLARHVFDQSAALGGPFAAVEEVTTAQYPTKARRPKNSRLSCEKLAAALGWRPPAWQDSCGQVVARLAAGQSADGRKPA